ncbi:MAG: histidine triad nucleotide-binding protein [Chlamydiales bacterium]|nr:histidine triad nucleotide-binding protein [Chlamydiales bacterium]
MKTLFEKIIEGELQAEKVYEDDKIVVIKDKFPKAPVHLLIIPRKPVPKVQALADEDFHLVGEVFRIAQKMAKEFGLEENGYRVIVNNGPDSGQEIDHLHFHLMGGRRLGPMG